MAVFSVKKRLLRLHRTGSISQKEPYQKGIGCFCPFSLEVLQVILATSSCQQSERGPKTWESLIHEITKYEITINYIFPAYMIL